MNAKMVGFGVRRLTITKAMIERLAQIKKDNCGSIANTVEVYLDEVGNSIGDLTVIDIVRFAENCEQKLADWDKPNGQYVKITKTVPV